MHKKYNKFLIISFVAFIVFGVYTYFYNDLISEAAQEKGQLTSSLDGGAVNPINISKSKVMEDLAFISKLSNLKKLGSLDTSLFSDKLFTSLVDNKIKLEQAVHGRVNPFSPIGNDFSVAVQKVSFTLTTQKATSIEKNSAFLNGSLEGVSSDNIYFEYGETETLGKKSDKVLTSLVGIFSLKVNGLKEKTKYYYRSVSNIDGVNSYGEIISFNTI